MDFEVTRRSACYSKYCSRYFSGNGTYHIKKNELKPHLRKCWVIPPEQNGNFVAHMEDILEVYKRPYDPSYPVVCVDEQPDQLIVEPKNPIPMKPGMK